MAVEAAVCAFSGGAVSQVCPWCELTTVSVPSAAGGICAVPSMGLNDGVDGFKISLWNFFVINKKQIIMLLIHILSLHARF